MDQLFDLQWHGFADTRYGSVNVLAAGLPIDCTILSFQSIIGFLHKEHVGMICLDNRGHKGPSATQ